MDGSTESEWVSPRGVFLAHYCLYYINDLSDGLVSEVFMFADDTKIYREIKDDRRTDTAVRHSLCTTGMVQPIASSALALENVLRATVIFFTVVALAVGFVPNKSIHGSLNCHLLNK